MKMVAATYYFSLEPIEEPHDSIFYLKAGMIYEYAIGMAYQLK